MKTKLFVWALIAVAPMSGICAQRLLTVDSCRNLAISNNKSIRIANAGIDAASLMHKSAKAAYLPGIDFSMSYFYNQHKISLLGEDAKLPTMSFDPATKSYQYNLLRNPETGEPMVDPTTGNPIPSEVAVIPKEAMTYDIHNVAAGAVTLTQPIFMGGAIRAMNGITKYAELLARSSRNAAVQEVVFAVDEAYWQVVSLKSKQLLADSYVALTDSFLYNVEAMYEQGVATRSDILTVQVKANEAQIARTKVANGLSLSRMALAQLCGLPIHEQFELSDESIGDTLPSHTEALRADMDKVYASRQDLASLRHGISIFEHKEKLALAEMLPKLAIVGAYSFSNPNTISGFQKRFGGGFSVGATLTVPIWHWGGDYNRYKAAKVETNMQRLLLEDAQEKVDLQVSQARYKYDEAFKTLNMTVTNCKKADENLRQAQLAFKEGQLTTDDVIAAHTAWLQAHSENIDALIGVRLCSVYLSKVLGTMPY